MVQNIYAGLMPSTRTADLIFLQSLRYVLSTKAPNLDTFKDNAKALGSSFKTDYTMHALYWCAWEM